jgi:hypothetical protein
VRGRCDPPTRGQSQGAGAWDRSRAPVVGGARGWLAGQGVMNSIYIYIYIEKLSGQYLGLICDESLTC